MRTPMGRTLGLVIRPLKSVKREGGTKGKKEEAIIQTKPKPNNDAHGHEYRVSFTQYPIIYRWPYSRCAANREA